MNTEPRFRKHAIAAGIALALASSLVSAKAFAQAEADAEAQADEEEIVNGVPRPTVPAPEPDGDIEEVVVLGRFISGSQQLVNERMNDAFATDLLGADTISRLGDSTVGAALRRVPGLTLVQDRFVYIRGLGERYTTTLLNGAQIPSPDLTRNVVPLDIFPATVVDALRVQKAYSPALPANFGGGMVDIRTKSIPDAFTLKLEAGIQHNTETPSRVSSYAGGSDDWLGSDDGSRALSAGLSNAINRFTGSFSDQNIQGALLAANPDLNRTDLLFQTEQLRRELAANLNRDISILQKSTEPDYLLRASMGNKFVLGESGDWE
ncbi:MAG: TonB-dependent receptor plug domain-containing protein, partial [Woeseiaceae bacterium]|nr:TonB-dependent receptor plug domain-containing protein [Woeseiaceae bacterium]